MIKRYYILLLVFALVSCEKSQISEDTLVKLYGDVYEDIGYSIANADGGYVIGGQVTEVDRSADIALSAGNKKMVIIKTGADGNVIWKRSFGDPLTAVGSKVIVLDDGSIVSTGYVISKDSLIKKLYVVKVDAGGNTIKEKIYSSKGNQEGTDIIKTSYGFLVIGSTDVAGSGSSTNVSGKKDIYIRKIDNNLELLPSPPNVGFPGNDIASAIKQDLNGGFIIAGTTDRYTPSDKLLNDVFLLKVNSDGNYIDMVIFEEVRDEYASDFEVTADGYILPVTVGTDGTTQSGYIMKVPANMASHDTGPDLAFSSTLNISSYCFKSITKYKTNSFVIAGQSGTNSVSKMLLFVIGADGGLVSGEEKKISGTGAQAVYDVMTDADDNVIAVGKNSYDTNSMISLLKFRF